MTDHQKFKALLKRKSDNGKTMKNEFRSTRKIKQLERLEIRVTIAMIFVCILASVTIHPLACTVPAVLTFGIVGSISEAKQELKNKR